MKTCLTGYLVPLTCLIHVALLLFKTSFTAISSVANAGHDRLFAIYKGPLAIYPLHKSLGISLLRVNDSAWVDGKLVLEETVLNSLEKTSSRLGRKQFNKK